MANGDFEAMRSRAIQNAREMQKRAVEPNNTKGGAPNDMRQFRRQTHSNPIFDGLNSMLGSLFKDSDTVLILAMIILLASDGADKILIFALLYIMS